MGIIRRWWDTTFAVELLLLAVTAPILYFPVRFEPSEIAFAIGFLALGWVWRRLMIGIWYQRTPADWAIFFLFFVMLPVSLWAAPAPLREEYSIPRALILIWNFFLFWTIVSHASRRAELRNLSAAAFVLGTLLIAGVALLGTQWPSKLPGISLILDRIPQILAGAFSSAEDGFNSNQVAGTLLYSLPLLIVFVFDLLRRRRWWFALPMMVAVSIVTLVFVAAQSRAAYLGLTAAIGLMVLYPWRWGRYLIFASLLLATASLFVLPIGSWLENLGGDTLVGSVSMAGRMEIWNRAVYGIADFPFTGMGLGTFREIVRILYPLFSIPPMLDLGHAHNFFLQMALDFGIPGLISMLVVYLTSILALILLWRRNPFVHSRTWAVGGLAVLLGQSLYSLADAVSMGAKPNFMFWFLFALLFAVSVEPRQVKQIGRNQG